VMYWRVRKYGAREMLQQYGIHMALAFSLILNILLITTRPASNKGVSPEIKADFDAFARKVTTHILDTSYINYGSATADLIDSTTGELAPPVISALRQKTLLPSSREEFQASLKRYTDTKRVCAVSVKEIRQGDKDGQGLIPIDVTGVVAVHSAEESDPPGPVPFHFRYKVGFRPNTQTPIVGDFAELSP
jgi:hypothetical protein